MPKYNMKIIEENCTRITAIIKDTGLRMYERSTMIKIDCKIEATKWTVELKMHCTNEESTDIATLFFSIDKNKNNIPKFEQLEGINIKITDFYVNKMDNINKGIGTILWEVMINNVVNLYCLKQNITNKTNTFISGRLSSVDSEKSDWKSSFPFYLRIGSKILNELPQYYMAETMFVQIEGYGTSQKVTPIYDSDLVDCTYSLTKERTNDLSKKLIEKIGTAENYFIIFRFSYNKN